MAISRYPGNQATWTQDISIAPPGSLAAPLFDFYPSLGDVTIATATNIDTVKDGPMKIVRYGALTVNALLTTTQRCRGLMILCDSLVMGASGKISMTARGAAGSAKWPRYDITIPQAVRLSGKHSSQRAVIDYIKQNGIWIGDPVFWAFPDPEIADCRASITAGSVVLLSADGCGARGNAAGAVGKNGGTGAGGGGGRYNNSIATWGGEGRPWGGGSGGGGVGALAGAGPDADRYGGEGGVGLEYNSGYYGAGGTGNPGGPAVGGGKKGNDGTGGDLLIICRGNIVRNDSDSIEANGVDGMTQTGGSYPCGGAASGGGHVSSINGGTTTGTGNTTANGGVGGYGSGGSGRDGGAGSVVTKSFAQMGWA
jgi:hypothetical protein